MLRFFNFNKSYPTLVYQRIDNTTTDWKYFNAHERVSCS